MEVDFKDDEDIARIVRSIKVIAVVGLSPNEASCRREIA